MAQYFPSKCHLFYHSISCKEISDDLLLYRSNLQHIEKHALRFITVNALLSPSEQERVQANRHPDVKKRFIAGRILSRIILSHHIGIAPKRIDFQYTEHGKPEQNHNKTLSFNLSHSGDEFAFAVCHNSHVGVDIEQHKPRKQLIAIAEEICTKKEYVFFLSLENNDREKYFYQLWTLKEATLKAMGTGFSLPATSVGFTQHKTVSDWCQQLGQQEQWGWWHEHEKANNVSCSLAVKSL